MISHLLALTASLEELAIFISSHSIIKIQSLLALFSGLVIYSLYWHLSRRIVDHKKFEAYISHLLPLTASLEELLKQRNTDEVELADLLKQRIDDQKNIKRLEVKITELITTNNALKEKLKKESASWKLMKISSSCTDIRLGKATSSDVTCYGDGTTVVWTNKGNLPLPPSSHNDNQKKNVREWEVWCPCCRRPLAIENIRSDEFWKEEDPKDEQLKDFNVGTSRYAYVAALWGSSTGFVLGALTLAICLRQSNTSQDLVLLHTDDIPKSSLNLLGKLWNLKYVEFVNADQRLFQTPHNRFAGVFTKLHALSLTDYEKVILLDLDLVVFSNIDDLFDLPAPAATHRRGWGASHNTKIDGRTFFRNDGLHDLNNEVDWNPWGQGGGINAGLVLLAPNQSLYDRVMQELKMPMHPAHVSGSGPEQDYLSRLYAPWWSHIGVAYNYQPHRTFHALEAALGFITNTNSPYISPEQFPERLKLKIEDIKVVHLSGDEKIWDMMPWLPDANSEAASKILNDCAGKYFRIWRDLQGEDKYYNYYNLEVREKKLIHENADANNTVRLLVERAVNLSQEATTAAVKRWCQAFLQLPDFLSEELSLNEIITRVNKPESVDGALFKCGMQVEMWWQTDWFEAKVFTTHDDKTVSIVFVDEDHKGIIARYVDYSQLRRSKKELND